MYIAGFVFAKHLITLRSYKDIHVFGLLIHMLCVRGFKYIFVYFLAWWCFPWTITVQTDQSFWKWSCCFGVLSKLKLKPVSALIVVKVNFQFCLFCSFFFFKLSHKIVVRNNFVTHPPSLWRSFAVLYMYMYMCTNKSLAGHSLWCG